MAHVWQTDSTNAFHLKLLHVAGINLRIFCLGADLVQSAFWSLFHLNSHCLALFSLSVSIGMSLCLMSLSISVPVSLPRKALKFECHLKNALVMALLSRAQGNINIAHYLYWWVLRRAHDTRFWEGAEFNMWQSLVGMVKCNLYALKSKWTPNMFPNIQ